MHETCSGVFFHFDLSSPSPAVPLSFFPTPDNVTYGYSDFGSWMVTFETVSCESWAGYGNDTASHTFHSALKQPVD